MGLLDILQGSPSLVSPWGALYGSPLQQVINPYADAAAGIDATTLPAPSVFGPQPQMKDFSAMPAPALAVNPFDNPQQASIPQAAPFGISGPSSVPPSKIFDPNAPVPAPAPAPADAPVSSAQMLAPPTYPATQPAPAAPGGPVLGVGFPAAGPAPAGAKPAVAADDEEEETPTNAAPTQGKGLPVAAAPAAAPMGFGAGAGDRLGMAARGFMGNMAGGPIGALMGGLGSLITGRETDPTAIGRQYANQTAQALLAKGAAPADVQAAINNKTLMEALIKKYYPTEDKTPASILEYQFYEKAQKAAGKTPMPYEQFMDATARARASGQPFNIGRGNEIAQIGPDGKLNIIHKNTDANAEPTLDDATAKQMAQQYIATGDPRILQNLGRGAQGSANVVKVRQAIRAEADAQGLDGAALSQRAIDYAGDLATSRSLGTQQGRMGAAGIEAQGAIKLARQASAAVPRGSFVPVNQAIQAWQTATGDPAIRQFGAANNTLVNTFARAINPTGVGTVAAQEHAREILKTADSPQAYEAVLQQLDKEVEMAHNSPAQYREMFRQERERRLNGGKPPAAPGAPVASGTVNGLNWSVAQ